VALRAVPLGFDPGGVVVFRVALPDGSYESPAARRAFFEQLIERIGGVPGIERTGAVNVRPLGSGGAAATVVPLAGAPRGVAPVADVRIATPDYFATLGIKSIAGGGIAIAAVPGARSAVVNVALARALWPDRDAIGERFVLAMTPPDTVTVAGVVNDVRLGGPMADVRPTVYFPHAAQPAGAMDVVIRASLPVESVVALARRTVTALDGALPIYEIQTLTAEVNEVTARQRVELTLLAAFSMLALLLAATGIYGVLAMEVGARRREIAVRLALGAAPATVRAEVVRRALRLTLAGVVIGLAGALAVTRFMASLLFGIQPTDPATYLGVVTVLLAVAATAAWVPARLAASVDPMESMRAE
jgi:predicted permease